MCAQRLYHRIQIFSCAGGNCRHWWWNEYWRFCRHSPAFFFSDIHLFLTLSVWLVWWAVFAPFECVFYRANLFDGCAQSMFPNIQLECYNGDTVMETHLWFVYNKRVNICSVNRSGRDSWKQLTKLSSCFCTVPQELFLGTIQTESQPICFHLPRVVEIGCGTIDHNGVRVQQHPLQHNPVSSICTPTALQLRVQDARYDTTAQVVNKVHYRASYMNG